MKSDKFVSEERSEREILVKEAIKWLWGDKHQECATVGQFRVKMRRQFGYNAFERLVTDWPHGYDLTSFLRGDNPQAPAATPPLSETSSIPSNIKSEK